MPALHWLTRETDLKIAARTPCRLLVEEENYSYGDPDSGNLIVQGDNLEALKALLPFYAGQVKCIYIDPPYNTGAARIYDDNMEHTIWLSIMYPRLELLKQFLREDGTIFVQINDDEASYLKVMMDEIFGRNNYETTFFIKVRHEDRILREDIKYQLVIEQVFCYRKSDAYKAKRREKIKDANTDYEYDIEIKGKYTSKEKIAGYEVEIYRPEKYKIIYKGKGLGSLKSYQIRGSLITQSGSASEYYELNLRKRRKSDGLGTLYKIIGMGVKGDGLGYRYIIQPEKANSKNGFYFQGKPIKAVETKGLPYPNFYDFVNKFNNVGYEGEIEFKDGKKPEEYIQFFLELANTSPGDLVLDSFLGSGTTAAVAHKMGRRYIGIEMGEQAKTHCAARLKKVINGEQGGISEAVGWKGGGGFRFFKLGEAIFDSEGRIKSDISFENLAAHIYFTETKTPMRKSKKKSAFLGIHNDTAYALLYNGILSDKSIGGGNVLTHITLNHIMNDIDAASKKKGEPLSYSSLVIYGEATRLTNVSLKSNNIIFKQTPYDIKVW